MAGGSSEPKASMRSHSSPNLFVPPHLPPSLHGAVIPLPHPHEAGDALLPHTCNAAPGRGTPRCTFRLALRYRISIGHCQPAARRALALLCSASAYKFLPWPLPRSPFFSSLRRHLPSLPDPFFPVLTPPPRRGGTEQSRGGQRTMASRVVAVILAVLVGASAAAPGSEPWWNETQVYGTDANSGGSTGVFVGLTLIQSAAAKGAVCLDGSLPGYHLHRGFGSGANSWLVNLEGGGWCNDVSSCVLRKGNRRGSSNHMERQLQFTGIMSNRPEENPDFYNWNRVKVRYCDGGSFTGDGSNSAAGLYFRGQRIWQAAMDDLMAQGMRYANQALLAGCSAGGVSTILHCDEFRGLFPSNTRVKCLADAGMFLDTVDVSGRREMRSFFNGIVRLQGSGRSLPRSCTSRMDKTSCFFPQNVVPNIQTPTFILNTAYDVWQLQQSVAPKTADPQGLWSKCRTNHAYCNSNQLQFLQGFRNQMLDSVRGFSASRQNGMFINSCFAHCQSERQDTWYANNSPRLGNKRIAEAVGDWFFERGVAKYTDCAYPCDNTCHHLVFRGDH